MRRRSALRASAGGAAFSLLASLVALPVVQTRQDRPRVSLRVDEASAVVDRRAELVDRDEQRASRSRTQATTTTVAPRRAASASPRRPSVAPTPRRGGCGGWEGAVAQWSDWNPHEVCSVLMCESRGDPNARNRSGATGLMQVMNGSSDPQRNLEQAHAKWAKSGWRPWVCRP